MTWSANLAYHTPGGGSDYSQQQPQEGLVPQDERSQSLDPVLIAVNTLISHTLLSLGASGMRALVSLTPGGWISVWLSLIVATR